MKRWYLSWSPRCLAAWVGMTLLLCLGVGGCSSAHYKQSADDDVYRIIHTVEQQIFHQTNAFTINTAYSDLDPKAIAPQEIIDSRMVTNQQVIDLEQALALAVQNSREYQTQKEQLYLTALTLTGQQHQFSPQFFGSLTPTFSGDGSGDYNLAPLNPQFGVSQLFKSGGNLSVQLVNDFLRYYSGDPGVTLMSVLSVNFTQPLIRGFGKNNDAVESLTQAQRNVVYAIRTFDQFQKQFAVTIVNDYFTLLSLKDTVRNNYTNYLRRVDTTQYMEARSVDRARRSEVDQARSSELDARISYVDSVARYLTELDAFKITLGIPVSSRLFLDDTDLHRLEKAGLIGVPISQAAGFDLAVQSQAAILNSIDQFEDRKRKIVVAADKLKPGVDFFASARYQANDDDSVDYTDFNPDNFTYAAGFQIDLPFDRLPERNVYRTTLVQFEQALRSLTLTLDDYRDRIDRGLRTLEQRRLNHISQLDAVDVAQRRVENNNLLLEAGRTDVLEVRQAQDDLIRAQNALVLTMVNYLQARMQLLLDMGVIQTGKDQFWLQDPLAGRLQPHQLGPPPLQMPDSDLIPPDRFLEPSS